MENHNSHIAEFIFLFNQTARYHVRVKQYLALDADNHYIPAKEI